MQAPRMNRGLEQPHRELLESVAGHTCLGDRPNGARRRQPATRCASRTHPANDEVFETAHAEVEAQAQLDWRSDASPKGGQSGGEPATAAEDLEEEPLTLCATSDMSTASLDVEQAVDESARHDVPGRQATSIGQARGGVGHIGFGGEMPSTPLDVSCNPGRSGAATDSVEGVILRSTFLEREHFRRVVADRQER